MSRKKKAEKVEEKQAPKKPKPKKKGNRKLVITLEVLGGIEIEKLGYQCLVGVVDQPVECLELHLINASGKDCDVCVDGLSVLDENGEQIPFPEVSNGSA